MFELIYYVFVMEVFCEGDIDWMFVEFEYC